MLKFVVLTYVLFTTRVESSQNVTNDTSLQWLVFIGGNMNLKSHDSLNKSLQLFYGVETRPAIEIISATTNKDGNDMVYWSSFQMYYDEPDMESTINLYENMNEVNNKLNEGRRSNESEIICTGNMVFCYADNDPVCTDSKTIGPTHNMLTSYGPISINTDFNLSNIILIENWVHNRIEIFASMVVIQSENQNIDIISDIIEKELFSNGSLGSLSLKTFPDNYDNIYFKHISFKIGYDNLEDIYDDTGDPNNWSDKFTQFYYSSNNAPNTILYLSHITAVCSNAHFCDQFLNKHADETDKTDDEYKTWMIVAIVFICLFVFALIGILMILWKSGKCNPFDESQSGYSKPTEIE